MGRGEGGEEGGKGREGEGRVGWSPPCEILNTPLFQAQNRLEKS